MTDLTLLPVLSEAVRVVRFDAHQTQSVFGARVGIHYVTLSLIESGKRKPTTDQLLRIGSVAKAGPAKTAIVEELRIRFRECPLVKVVA